MNTNYELLLNHINELNSRRQNITTVYLSVNTAILGVLVFISQDALFSDWIKSLSILAFIGAGIVACDLWRRLIIQYRLLLEWWYMQIRRLEQSIDSDYRLITQEYDQLYHPTDGKPKVGITRYEIKLIWLFVVIYLSFGIVFVLVVLI